MYGCDLVEWWSVCRRLGECFEIWCEGQQKDLNWLLMQLKGQGRKESEIPTRTKLPTG